MAAVTNILLPLIGIILTGFVAGKARFLDLDAARLLSRYVFLFAMPVAVLNFYMRSDPPTVEVIPVMLAYGGLVIVIMLATIFAAKSVLKLTMPQAGAHGFCSICGNAVFLGLPIALSVEGWGQPFLMLMIMEGLLVFGIGAIFLSWKDSEDTAPLGQRVTRAFAQSITLPFRNPIVVSSLVGIGIAWSGLVPPEPVSRYAALFGGTAGPTGLFVLGLFIANLPVQDIRELWTRVAMIGAVKLAALPLIVGTMTGLITGWDPTLTATATLFTAMPPAVTSLVQASHYRTYERTTAAALVILSPLSLVGIGLILILLA